MTKGINNADLTLEDLPDPDDYMAVGSFALSFNGYEHYGSFEKCAEVANSGSRSSLTELRNELFFAERASTHSFSCDEYVHTYRELLPLFRDAIKDKLA